MGIIPATGSEITMGRVGQAYGLGAAGTTQQRLSGDLAPQLGIAVSSSIRLSIDFGGQSTPNDY